MLSISLTVALRFSLLQGYVNVVARGLHVDWPGPTSILPDRLSGQAGDALNLQGASMTDIGWPPLPFSELPEAAPLSPANAKRALNISSAKCNGPSEAQISKDGDRPLFPSPAAAAEATGAEFGHVCEHLGKSLAEQFDAVVKAKGSETWAWTVSNSIYGYTLADWQLQLRRVGAPNALVVSMDKDPDWAKGLCSQGFQVVDATGQGDNDTSLADATFRMPEQFARLQVKNIFQELDIFWQRGLVNKFDKLWSFAADADIVMTYQAADFNEPTFNIGFWMSPERPSPSTTNFFNKANEITSTTSKWDQEVVNKLARQCCTIVNLLQPGVQTFPKYPLNLTCPESLRGVRVALLPVQSVIMNGFFKSPGPEDDAFAAEKKPADPEAVHIWAENPLHMTSGWAKVVVAKNAGMFEGAGCYYEECSGSQTRYIAWDGILPDNGHAAAMELLLDLAWSLNRTVILPRVNKSFGWKRFGKKKKVLVKKVIFGEKIFGTTHLDHVFSFRESNFLYQPFLPKTAMYPVTRLMVGGEGSASLQSVTQDLSSNTIHFELPAGTVGEDAAFALSEMPEAVSSKTLLVSVDSLTLNSCGGVKKALPLCDPSSMRGLFPKDVC